VTSRISNVEGILIMDLHIEYFGTECSEVSEECGRTIRITILEFILDVVYILRVLKQNVWK